MTKNFRELPKLRDSLSFLYVDYSKVEKKREAICLIDKNGETDVPVASLGVLMLGPGTSVSHGAIKLLADNGCSILWVGENGIRLYGQGIGETHSAIRLLKQAHLHSNLSSRMAVVINMYQKRFSEKLSKNFSIEQIRGKEGVRVRRAYFDASKKFNVEWNGRNYNINNWSSSDYINKALSTAASCLYGISHCAIVSAGYSPSLGFIHTGRLLSFVYDVADLYRVDTIIPIAFEITSNCQRAQEYKDLERLVRIKCRDVFFEQKILKRIINDLEDIFNIEDQKEEKKDLILEEDALNFLWDPLLGEVKGGESYGDDCC